MKDLWHRTPPRVANQDLSLLLVGRPAVLFDSLEKTNRFEIGSRLLQQTAVADEVIRRDPKVAFEPSL